MKFCLFAVLTLAAFGQNDGTASIRGVVRDAHGQPIAGATVELTGPSQKLNAATDSAGTYRFQALAPATYTVDCGDARLGPFQLQKGEVRKIDVTLGAAAKAQFFDEPNFIVAGVTDPAQRGGHGTDTVFRSTETLAKDTASLRTNAAPSGGSADRHHALAEEEEKSGDALDAAREYQRAAEIDSSEANLFDWGVELLKHRAAAQAAEVFARANRSYPRSTRVLLGLAVALYARGSYDEAARRFFEAADLNPDDPEPYLFLTRLPDCPITEAPGYAQHLERFVTRQPESAEANYYFAAWLWRKQTAPATRVESLLEKAARIDPHFAPASLLLGVVLAQQKRWPEAIAAYQTAIAAGPPTPEVHYRLAQALERIGATEKAHRELEIYRQLSEQSAKTEDRERSEIQDFVFRLRKTQ